MRTVDTNGSHTIDAPDRPCIVGLISDTHGLIRPEALKALRHSDLIVHCGDVGDPSVLEALESGRAARLPFCRMHRRHHPPRRSQSPAKARKSGR